MNKSYFLLFANCIPVKGAKKSIICDLQRNSFLNIPNELYKLLTSNDYLDLAEVNEEKKESIDYLINHEYGFLTNEPELFPRLSNNTNQEVPNLLIEFLIDFDEKTKYDFHQFSKEMERLRVTSIEFRFFHILSLEEVGMINNIFLNPNIRNCSLSLQFNNETEDKEKILAMLNKYNSITQVLIFNAPYDELIKYGQRTLIYTKSILRNEKDCGRVSPFYFESNMTQFKNRAFNTCLKRKLSVNRFGEVKICPAMDFGFGKVNSVNFDKLINNKKVQKYQNINKDQISVCKDCEFRYICTDCRAFTEDDKLYSKPKKCNYDPYTATWL